MKHCKNIYSKKGRRKRGTKERGKIFSNVRREHLSETDKGSYCNQSERLEEYGNSGLSYSRTFDKTYTNGFTSDNISDTSDEVELQSSDEDYEGGETQGNKDNETMESSQDFDCYIVIYISVFQSMLHDFAVCKY